MAEHKEEQPTVAATAAANWSEEVEDLVSSGDTTAAISFLESFISRLDAQPQPSDLQLASALTELAKLYSTTGFSLKADQLHSHALIIRRRALLDSSSCSSESELGRKDLKTVEDAEKPDRHPLPDSSSSSTNGNVEQSGDIHGSENASNSNAASDDDWEAVADREPKDLLPTEDWEANADCAPNELLHSKGLPEVSKLSVEDKKPMAPKRRGRGTFSYKKQKLYSDQLQDNLAIDEEGDEDPRLNSEETAGVKHSKYGTRHVLVLTEFPPSTRTIELEKLLEDFRDRGVVIRWVNDTTALAVFRTPATALEAHNSIRFPFTVRVLGEEDVLLSSIPVRDVEPPRQRPKTSARTAQRLIAQVMGLKLTSSTSSSSGSSEFKRQEEARKERIVTRQKLRDDAWGADED